MNLLYIPLLQLEGRVGDVSCHQIFVMDIILPADKATANKIFVVKMHTSLVRGMIFRCDSNKSMSISLMIQHHILGLGYLQKQKCFTKNDNPC